jgi:hypothetical protein
VCTVDLGFSSFSDQNGSCAISVPLARRDKHASSATTPSSSSSRRTPLRACVLWTFRDGVAMSLRDAVGLYVKLDLIESRTLDGRLQMLEYAPTVLDGPPGAGTR